MGFGFCCYPKIKNLSKWPEPFKKKKKQYSTITTTALIELITHSSAIITLSSFVPWSYVFSPMPPPASAHSYLQSTPWTTLFTTMAREILSDSLNAKWHSKAPILLPLDGFQQRTQIHSANNPTFPFKHSIPTLVNPSMIIWHVFLSLSLLV